MARLALAIAGGIIGALIPGIGWSIGFLIGNVVGSILFPPKGPDGPRLNNLSVTSSIYGTMINQGFGTVRVPGNIIWGLNIKEKKHSAGKGGMAGGGGAGNTYTYSWTGAVAVGRGPIRDILRIWADTKLVYDKTGATPAKSLPSKRSFRFRLYKGTETQVPDPAIEHDVGAANATAHRGMAYVLFDDIQLADYGNRIPSFTFEVAWSGSDTTTEHNVTEIVAGDLTVTQSNSILAVDWDRDRLFTGVVGSGNKGFRQYSLRTMAETMQVVTPWTPFSLAVCGEDNNGAMYVSDGGSNTQPYHKMEGDGLVNVYTFGVSGGSLDNEQSGFVAPGSMDFIRPAGLDGVDAYLFVGSTQNDIGLLHASDMTYVWGKEVEVAEARVSVCGGQPALDEANGWALGHASFGPSSTADFSVYQLRVLYGAFVGTNPDTGTNDTMVFMSNNFSFGPSDIHANWHEFTNTSGFIFDESDNTLIFGVTGGPNLGPYTSYICKFDPEDNTFVWKSLVAQIVNVDNGHNQSRLRGQKYAYLVGSNLYEIDTVKGAVTTSTVTSVVNGAQVYDSERDAIVAMCTVSATAKPVLLLLSRGEQDSHGVGIIIQDVCEQVGLDAATDIDVSGVTDEIKGYLLNQQMAARSAIEPLGFIYLFDGAEIDYKIKFVHRGQSVALSLTEDQLVRQSEETGAVIEETRTQELELPRSVSVVYMDIDKDYQQNTMTARRISNPTPTMYSRNESTTTVPAVLDATEALRIADRSLWSAWTERILHKYKLDWASLAFDPTDVVEITLNTGIVIHDRIISGDVGADYSMEWTSVSERSVQYTSNLIGNSGDGFEPQTPVFATASRYFLMDTPFFRDQDAAAAGSTTSKLHTTAGGYGAEGWPGEQVLKSADGATYLPAATLTSAVTWGVVTTAPGDTPCIFSWDTDNTVVVSMVNGEDNLASVTRLEALNGSNGGLLLNEFTGIVEIFLFSTVTQNTEGTFTLSDLRRGMRGTDPYVGAHSTGEIFILLDPATMDQINMGIDELNLSRYFIGVQIGDLQEEGVKKTIVSTGRDLKPWAPGNNHAIIAGSDLTLSWDRRTRFGGGLVDVVGTVPLFETTEAYEIDIYDAPGTTVLRTLTSTVESVTYTAANITTDFGSIPATLSFAVYQMSGVVGRGFGVKRTVDTA